MVILINLNEKYIYMWNRFASGSWLHTLRSSAASSFHATLHQCVCSLSRSYLLFLLHLFLSALVPHVQLTFSPKHPPLFVWNCYANVDSLLVFLCLAPISCDGLEVGGVQYIATPPASIWNQIFFSLYISSPPDAKTWLCSLGGTRMCVKSLNLDFF